jgi:hypothetical protein
LEKSTSGMDIGSLSTGLTERIKTYICDLNSEGKAKGE